MKQFEMKRFENKIAVVTGAANGIGECMVNRLLNEGAEVAALDIEGDTLKEKFGSNPKVLCLYCDVAKKRTLIGRFKRLSITLVELMSYLPMRAS